MEADSLGLLCPDVDGTVSVLLSFVEVLVEVVIIVGVWDVVDCVAVVDSVLTNVEATFDKLVPSLLAVSLPLMHTK